MGETQQAQKILQQAISVILPQVHSDFESKGEAIYYDALAGVSQAQTPAQIEAWTPNMLKVYVYCVNCVYMYCVNCVYILCMCIVCVLWVGVGGVGSKHYAGQGWLWVLRGRGGWCVHMSCALHQHTHTQILCFHSLAHAHSLSHTLLCPPPHPQGLTILSNALGPTHPLVHMAILQHNRVMTIMADRTDVASSSGLNLVLAALRQELALVENQDKHSRQVVTVLAQIGALLYAKYGWGWVG